MPIGPYFLCARTHPPSRSLMLERMEKFKHFFTTFLRGAFGPGAGSCYLRGTLRRAYCGGAYSVPCGSRQPGPPHAAGAWSNW